MKLLPWISIVVISLPTILVSGSETDPDSGISFFEGTLEEALDQAKQSDLPVFVDSIHTRTVPPASLWPQMCGSIPQSANS